MSNSSSSFASANPFRQRSLQQQMQQQQQQQNHQHQQWSTQNVAPSQQQQPPQSQTQLPLRQFPDSTMQPPIRTASPADSISAPKPRPPHSILNSRLNTSSNSSLRPLAPALSIQTTGSARSSPKPKTVRIADPPVPVSPVTPVWPVTSPTAQTFDAFGNPMSPEGSGYGEGYGYAPWALGGAGAGPEEEETDYETDEEVKRNTRSNALLALLGHGGNSELGAGPGQSPFGSTQDAAVRNTLARLPAPSQGQKSLETMPEVKRATMDVDAFTKMLMGGKAPVKAQATMPAPAPVAPPQANNAVPDAVTTIAPSEKKKQKPPPPKTRHGKKIVQEPTEKSNVVETSSPAGLDSPSIASPIAAPKRPPTPPITRRQHASNPSTSVTQSRPHRLSLERQDSATSSSRLSVLSDYNTPLKTPPPPPASRRSVAQSSSSTSSFFPLPSPLAADDPSADSQSLISRSSSISSRVASGSGLPSAATTTTTHQPPAPPPPRRRRRASSKGSVSEAISVRSGLDSPASATTALPQSIASAAPPPPPPPPRTLSADSLSTLQSVSSTVDTENEVTASAAAVTASTAAPLAPATSNSNASSILADLSRLQQDLDRVMGRG